MQDRRHFDLVWAGTHQWQIDNFVDEPDEGAAQLRNTLESPPVVADDLGLGKVACHDGDATILDFDTTMRGRS